MDLEAIPPAERSEEHVADKNHAKQKIILADQRKLKLEVAELAFNGENAYRNLHTLLSSDEDVNTIIIKKSDESLALWEEGIDEYLSGSWNRARDTILQYQQSLHGRKDSISEVLMDFMDSNGWDRPEDWLGWRSLHQK